MIIGGLITLTGAVLLLPLSTDAFFAIFLLINLIFGGFSTAINIPMMTWITQVVPTHYQGRIFQYCYDHYPTPNTPRDGGLLHRL